MHICVTADADAFINDPSIFRVESQNIEEMSFEAWEIRVGLGGL